MGSVERVQKLVELLLSLADFRMERVENSVKLPVQPCQPISLFR
jgi:hypothetical protein